MTLHQATFRFGIDEGTESTHGWHQVQNTDMSFGVNATFLMRFGVQAAGGVAHSNIDFQFQYDKNFTAFNNITTTSSVVKAVTTVAYVHAANCTNRLVGLTGTFETSAAGCSETGVSGGTACDIVSNGCTETVCALQIVGADVVNGDTIKIRLLQETLVMTSYDQQPTITVIKSTANPLYRPHNPAIMSILMR